jgi:hypothetical protein
MATLHYQVLVMQKVTEKGWYYYIATIPDLKCEAIGTTPTEAVEAARARAISRIQYYERKTIAPPAPSHLTLAVIDLPSPKRRRNSHLRVVPDLADSQTPHHHHQDAVASDG